MTISNIRFSNVNNIEGGYTTAETTFTYRNKSYSVTVLIKMNGQVTLTSIYKLDGNGKLAKFSYDNKEVIGQLIEQAWTELCSVVNAYEATVMGMEYNELLNHYNTYASSNSELELYDWMDTQGI